MDGLGRLGLFGLVTVVLVSAPLTGSAFVGRQSQPTSAGPRRSVGGGGSTGQKTVAASEAWIRLPAAGETSATALVVIDNPTMYDVYLVSATSDVAGTVQFRQKAAATDASTETVNEIAAPAYGRLQLSPDGVHILLLNLTRALKEGETLSLTLTTDAGVALQVPALVRKP